MPCPVSFLYSLSRLQKTENRIRLQKEVANEQKLD